MKKYILLLSVLLSSFVYSQNEMYELRVYELNFGKSPKVFYNYIEDALIPALNRQGVENVGFFEEVGDAMPKKVYLLIPYESMTAFDQASNFLKEDALFKKSAKEYSEMSKEVFPIKRYTTSLFRAFDGLPKLVNPENDSMVFELRTYEGYNEDAVKRKVN